MKRSRPYLMTCTLKKICVDIKIGAFEIRNYELRWNFEWVNERHTRRLILLDNKNNVKRAQLISIFSNFFHEQVAFYDNIFMSYFVFCVFCSVMQLWVADFFIIILRIQDIEQNFFSLLLLLLILRLNLEFLDINLHPNQVYFIHIHSLLYFSVYEFTFCLTLFAFNHPRLAFNFTWIWISFKLKWWWKWNEVDWE